MLRDLRDAAVDAQAGCLVEGAGQVASVPRALAFTPCTHHAEDDGVPATHAGRTTPGRRQTLACSR
jgi:hypothetical protein